MTREEWYKHKTLDAIEQVRGYIELVLDGEMDTNLTYSRALDIQKAVSHLDSDITLQLSFIQEKEN